MSAIGGILYFNNYKVKKDLIEKMSGNVSHRGPDNSQIWFNSNIGLYNNLHDASYEKRSPLNDRNLLNQYAITSDSRIDNQEYLLQELGLKDNKRLYTENDLILLSYKKWGYECTDHLLGDFSFAIWDKNKKELFCARDHFGLKPFIYYCDNNLFVFSSEIKPIFCVNQVLKSINKNRIADFIVQDLEGIDNYSTFFNSIYKLPPAHSLIIRNKKLKLNKYWNFFKNNKYLNFNKNYDFEENFVEIFSTAVKRRTQNTETNGLTLSGGIDSASIAVIANKVNGKNKIKFISATLENHEDIFEKPYIVDLENNNNIAVNYINENYINDYQSILLNFISETDDLFDVNMNLIIPICIYAQKNNIKSLVFGVDGDLVCSDNISSTIYLIKSFQMLSAYKIIYKYAKFNHYNFYELFWDNIFKPLIPSKVKYLYKTILRKKDLNYNLIPENSMINPEFSKKINLEDRYRRLNNIESLSAGDSLPLHVKLRCNLLTMPFITSAIERYERVCSRFSLESRHPFFDKELVEFCINIPLEKKLHDGRNKSILRNSLRKLLPRSIYEKKDSFHLGPFYQNNFLDIFNNELNILADNNFYPVSEYLDSNFLHSSFLNYKKSKDFEKYGNYLWRALTLDIWLKNNCN